MWRRIVRGVLLAAVGTVAGQAASVNIASNSLGAAVVSTPRCTAGAMTVLQNLSGGTIVSVTVGNLPAGCGGATLQATVNNGVASASGSIAVPAGGGSVTVVLGTAPLVTAAEQTDLVIVGP